MTTLETRPDTRISIADCKSYATEDNLLKAIDRLELGFLRHIVVRTPEGRWTAIFLVTEYLRANGGYVGLASQHGFMSV